MKGLCYIVLFSLMIMACTASKNEISDNFQYRVDHMWINSVEAPCASVGKPGCLQTDIVRSNQPEKWRTFYHDIIGFRYEAGYIYKLKVRVDFADSTSDNQDFLRYTLIEEESKIKDYSLELAGEWSLTTINGDSVFVRDSSYVEPYIQFPSDLDRVSGHSGCNNFTGNFNLRFINKLKLGPMISTRKICQDMEVEQQMLAATDQVDEFIIKDDKLALQDYNGKVLMTFERKE